MIRKLLVDAIHTDTPKIQQNTKNLKHQFKVNFKDITFLASFFFENSFYLFL